MSKPWKFIVAVSLIAIITLFADDQNVHACSCEGPTGPAEAFDDSDAVFRGMVISKIGLRSECGSSGSVFFRDAAIEFKVTTVWKGELNETAFITTNYHGATCGYPFRIGEEYIVYADGRNGVLRVGLCSRTRPVSSAEEDFEILGEGRNPEPGSTDLRPVPEHLGEECLSTTPDPSPEMSMPATLPATGGCVPLVHNARVSLDAAFLLLPVGVIWLRTHSRRRR